MAKQILSNQTDRKGLQRREFLLALPAATCLPLPPGETPDPEGRLSPSEKKQFDDLLVLREKLDRIIKSGDEDANLTVDVILNLVLQRIKESRLSRTNIQSRATDPITVEVRDEGGPIEKATEAEMKKLGIWPWGTGGAA